MFVRNEVLLDLGFDAAQAGLANLARRGALETVSKQAHREGPAAVIEAGQPGPAWPVTHLVEVRHHDLITGPGSAYLMLRWPAAGPGSAAFPALDADITLTPSGDEATVLALDGVYRPPPCCPDAELDELDGAAARRVMSATVRAFVGRLADAVTRAADDAGSRGRMAGHDLPGLPPVAGTA
jgi:hypothetical protein